MAQLVECWTWDQRVASLRLTRGIFFVSLGKSLNPLLSTGSTQEDRKADMTEKLLTGM